jgi:hypothetical protein
VSSIPAAELHVEIRHGYALVLPRTAPSGVQVTIVVEDIRGGAHRLHAATPDGHELYVEVVTHHGLVDHGKASDDQRRFLRERAPGGAIDEIEIATIAGRPATRFDFRGTLGGHARVRRFAFVDANGRTYRLVHDPTSAASVEAIDSWTSSPNG